MIVKVTARECCPCKCCSCSSIDTAYYHYLVHPDSTAVATESWMAGNGSAGRRWMRQMVKGWKGWMPAESSNGNPPTLHTPLFKTREPVWEETHHNSQSLLTYTCCPKERMASACQPSSCTNSQTERVGFSPISDLGVSTNTYVESTYTFVWYGDQWYICHWIPTYG